MDRQDRFATDETRFYAPPLPRSQPPADTANVIDLHDLNDWMRQQRRQQQQQQQEPTSGRQDARGSKKDWPSFVVEKQLPSPGFEDDVSLKTPDPRYDENFLHPPTPKRDSFVKVESAARHPGDDDDTAELRPRRLSVNLERSSRFGWWTLCLFLITVIMVTLTAIYSDGSAKPLWRDKFFTTSSSNAILILRSMTEACALLLATLVVVVVEDLQWALASRPQGVGLLHFIGLDSGTGVWGLLRLLATADWKQKYSSLFRWVHRLAPRG